MPRSAPKEVSSGLKIPIGYAIGFVALGIIIGLVIKESSNSSEQSVRPVTSFQPATGMDSPAVLAIARDYMCLCGNCTDPLDICKCEHAKGALEVKAFISQQLQGGHKSPHIKEMLMQKYPNIKVRSQ